ncbi:MAG: transcriptional regulator, AfsR/DnrI/RedD family [Candidatus Eremiobacteraeota bacterium]|nr:transcriptional regulator, AfsR/DnrI/RedD family [Candidatus Eremiobacteraeota bacterium]
MLGPVPNLADFIAEGAPRVLTIWGPPGYDKTAFLRSYAGHAGLLTLCDLPVDDEPPNLARVVLEAMLERDRALAVRSAVDRLALRREQIAANSREALRREWPVAADPELFALRDPFGALPSPAGADLVGELVGTLPPKRTLALVTRAPLPSALQQIVSRETSAVIGPPDLSLGVDDVLAIAEQSAVSVASARAVHDVAHGWPLVTRLLLLLEQRDRDPELLAEAASVPRDMLLALVMHRTIARLKDVVRDGLLVASLRPGSSQADLVRVLGDGCDDFVFAQLSALPFVETENAKLYVHAEIVRLLRERFGPLVKALYERVLSVLAGEGEYVQAAQVALGQRDVMRAAAMIDAAPTYFAVPVTLQEYERVIDRLDRSLITRFPNLWIATIPYRNFSVDRATFVREAETVYYCLPSSASADQRAAMSILLANAYANAGRIAECEQVIDDALSGFARDASPARASMLNFVASLRGIEGRFRLARALASEAAALSPTGFAENQTLHYIEAHEATYRGKVERIVVIFDELLRRSERDELPLHVAMTAGNAAFFTWANGADADFERYLIAMEDALLPGIERGFAPMIDAARGRSPQLEEGYSSPVVAAIAHLYRMGVSGDRDVAVDAARAAVRAADQRRDPYVQILAHAALYTLDASARAAEAQVLRAIVEPIESAELHAAIGGLLTGGAAGVLEPFLQQRVVRARAAAKQKLTIDILSARVTRDGARVQLSDKEFELLALLATAHGPLSRDRIGEALWDHLDPEEWPNNLKVTLSRLRGKLAERDAVIAGNGSYRLSPSIDVDLRRAEALVRECEGGMLDDAKRDALRAALDSYDASASSRYDRYVWMQSTLARINELLCRAGMLLAADALRAERLDDALAYARRVEAIDPYDEAACELVLRVHRVRGDSDAARREFRRYATALANELGATPSRRLAELVRAAD